MALNVQRLRDPQVLGLVQGVTNIVGGAWPLASMRTFEWIFGRKVDHWLVRTVACLLVANGTAQVLAVRSGDVRAARRVGIGTAASLGIIDAVYVPRGRIRWTYGVDGIVEGAWIALWAAARMPAEVTRSSEPEVRSAA